MTNNALKACAEILSSVQWTVPARCNVARCGASYLGAEDDDVYYAGMVPVRMLRNITAALTELPGEPADPRQSYNTAFDNPSMTLHIIGDDLVWLDKIANEVLTRFDRISHITTQYGTVNGMRVNPPRRTVRNDRPRYDVQLSIEMEMART